MAKLKTTKKTQTNNLKRHIKTFWKLLALGVFLIFFIFLLASWGVFGQLPDETSLENPEKNLATKIIGSDGVILREVL